MVFEIFFDSEGRLRDEIKGKYFQEVFELQRHRDLKGSFDFIAEALLAARADFFSVPGKGHELPVTISTAKKDDLLYIDAIYVGSVNILKDPDEPWLDADDNPVYSTITQDNLEAALCEQMVIPNRLLKVTYIPREVAKNDTLRIQRGWAVRKN